MKFNVYILYSEKINSFYKGQTSNLPERLYRHNHRYEKATKAGAPWKLIWTSEKPSRSEALSLERKLKNLSVKRTLQFILKYSQGIPSTDELLMIQQLSEC
jgi:putative endonuclease